MRKSLLKLLIELLAIPLSHQKAAAKSLVILKLLGVVAALTLPTYVSAIGMGGINVASALGQPLKADVELVSVNKTQKASMVARLASPDIYKGAGLEYPYGNKFTFQIESRANGEPYLKVGSAQPINDPFVSLLVELTWSSGKLLREYTFLLDPPGYVAEQPAPTEVQAVAPVVPVVTGEAVEQIDLERRPQQEVVEPAKEPPQPVRAPKDEKPISAPAARAPEKRPAASIATGNITIGHGDTLSKIAAQNKPDDVSLERMLVALYRANAEQFDGKNMNRIRTGKILRLPDQSELLNVSQSDATKEIRAHVADWNIYRQKLASAAAIASQSQDARQVASGKIASSVADKAPVAKESAKEILKLSKGKAPGDQAGVAGKSVSAEDKKNAAQEDAIAKAKAAREEQARAALLEKNLKDMQRLAELKSEAAASKVAVASEVKPKPAAKPEPKVVEPEPSLLDQILAEPLYLAGGAAALLGLGGLGFMLNRRRQTSVAATGERGEETGAITGRIAAPVMPSPDTGDFTSVAAEHAEITPQADEVDPISEADLFLNFGRDAQAEEILKEALRNTPNNHQLHLKLLGIYANRKDTNSFSAIAHQLQDSGDEDAWHQAAAMGRKLEPNNPMYSGAGAIGGTDSATMQTMAFGATPDFVLGETSAAQETSVAEVDFDLGISPEESAALPEQDFSVDIESTTALTSADTEATQAATMDFDVTATSPSLAAPIGMDFDIAPTHPPMMAAPIQAEETVPSDMDDLIFDVTATHPPVPAAPVQAEETVPSNMDDLIFDVTATHPPMMAAPVQAEETVPSDMDDLIFDVTATHPPMPAAQPESAKPSDAVQDDGAMEFMLDFPIEDVAEKPAPAAKSVDAGLAGISLNLDDIAEPNEPAAEVKDEHWHEVATKLDLARAYQEMGDATGAREILDEVLHEGDEGQREAAQTLLDQLG